jgi:hypothetical protein
MPRQVDHPLLLAQATQAQTAERVGAHAGFTSRGTMPDPIRHFEMRRLEALSNTIFGVAMTLEDRATA